MPVVHTYLSQDLSQPFCAEHGFATIRWDGAFRDESAGGSNRRDRVSVDTSKCFHRYVDEFTLRVGQCAPPSINLYMLADQSCDPSFLYQDCPPCDTDLTLYTPAAATDPCQTPKTINRETGELWWDLPEQPQSYSGYSQHLNMTGQAIRRHLKTSICKCLDTCYKGETKLTKTSVTVGDIQSWCEGRFAGVDINLRVNLPDRINRSNT